MQQVAVKCAGETHPGLERDNNEDRVHFDADRGIFIVIDGVGGQAAGDKAADTALRVVRARLERPPDGDTAEERLREAIALANKEILRLAEANEEWRGMACVMTVVLLEGAAVTAGHVGDTRLYKIHRGEIRKLTRDHSPVGEREDANEITEAEAMAHPRRNEVFRDVGSEAHRPDDEDFIDIVRTDFEPDCALLLCSDGLSDLVPSWEVLRLVTAAAGEPWRAVKELIAAANDAGGKDNISVVLAEGEQFAAAARRNGAPGAAESRPDAVTTRPLPNARAHLPRPEEPAGAPAAAVHDDQTGHRADQTHQRGEGPPRQPAPAADNAARPEDGKQPAKVYPDPSRPDAGRLEGGRWAYLLYGLCAGVLLTLAALYVWNALTSPAPDGGGPTATEAARTIVVRQGGDGDFKTIGEALKAARPGDTVMVAPGEYREHVQLKDGVALVSQLPRAAVIKPSGEPDAPSVAVFVGAVTRARLAGFQIVCDKDSPQEVGIRLVDARAEIEDNEVSGAFIGVEVDGTSTSAVRGNYIHGNAGGGIVVRGRAAPRLSNNVVIGNGKDPAGRRPGVDILSQARPSLVGNLFADNGAEAVAGVPASAEAEVLRNNFFGGEVKANGRGKVRVAGNAQP